MADGHGSRPSSGADPEATAVAVPVVRPSPLSLLPTLAASVRALLIVTVVCGLAYPLLVTGVAAGVFGDRADGTLERGPDGEITGSALIGAGLTGDEWFHARPSAAGTAAVGAGDAVDLGDRASTSSAASNLAPDNPDLLAAVAERAAAYRDVNGLAPGDPVPLDAVTASGSGLDPHISEANARLQAPRVAEARDLPLDDVLALVDANLDGRILGVFGAEGVNVQRLNTDLEAAASTSSAAGGS